MKIIDTKIFTSTVSSGHFHCPSCSSLQNYRLKSVKRFYTIKNIPVFPAGKIGEFVECCECEDSFDSGIVQIPPEKSVDMEAEYHRAVKKVMIHVLLADGIIDDNEIETLKSVYRKVVGREIGYEKLTDEINAIKEGSEEISSFKRLEGCLNKKGRDMVIKAAYFIAVSDGTFHSKEKDLIFKIGKMLGYDKNETLDLIERENTI